MSKSIHILLAAGLALVLLPACDAWNFEEYGGKGQPCYTNRTCRAGLLCMDGMCAPESADSGVDAGDGADRGDTLSGGDGDGGLADGDSQPGDADGGQPCVCGPPQTACCDGCFFTTNPCTPDDEFAQAGRCEQGICLIEQCLPGHDLSADRLSCPEAARKLEGAGLRPSATGASAGRSVQVKLRWCPGALWKE